MEILPYELCHVMTDTMSNAVPAIMNNLKGDIKKIKSVFNEHVFQNPFDKELLKNIKLKKEIELEESSLLGKEISYLHQLYNDPDASRVSSINADAKALELFRKKMKESFSMAKKTAMNFASFQEKTEEIPLDPSEWEAPPKTIYQEKTEEVPLDASEWEAPLGDNPSDEELIKYYQKQFDLKYNGWSKQFFQEHPPKDNICRVNEMCVVNGTLYIDGVPRAENHMPGCDVGSIGTVNVGDIKITTEKSQTVNIPHLKSNPPNKQYYIDGYLSDFELPEKSKNCDIKLATCRKIKIGPDSSDITITGNKCRKIIIKENCHNIDIQCKVEDLLIRTNCNDIKVSETVKNRFGYGDSKNIYVAGRKMS